MNQIFVSYKSENVHDVREIVEALVAKGFDVWFAEYGILSENYDAFVEPHFGDSISMVIDSCTHALVFTNDAWAQSSYCRIEIAHILERMPLERILQVCVPREDEPFLQYPSLERVPTMDYEQDVEQVVGFVSEHMPSGQHVQVRPPSEYLGIDPNGFAFRYGSIDLYPFERVPIPSHHDFIAREHLYHFEAGLGSQKALLEITVNPLRTAITPIGYTLTDSALSNDREIYKQLRQRAREWYRGSEHVEKGLHLLFWQRGVHMAMTFVDLPDHLHYWSRIYVLFVRDPNTGAIGEVDLHFRVMYAGRDRNASFRLFCRFMNVFDTIVNSFDYAGDQAELIPPDRKTKWTNRILGMIIFAVLGYFLLPYPFPWDAVVGLLAGYFVGSCWNYYAIKKQITPRKRVR